VRSQLEGLYWRELLRLYRNPWVLLFTLVQPFMWLAFFGSSFGNAPAGFVQSFFGSGSYIAFLLPGVLSTSMLSVGMFGSMSTIQDKRFGFMKRILLTPTSKATVFLSKALGSTTRGLVQVPVMITAAYAFGVRIPFDPLGWLGWVAALFLLAIGFSSLFLTVTASSTDWQTPGVLSNFITMPLMFASSSLFPQSNFPWWMQAIARVNPISISASYGRGVVLAGNAAWIDLGNLAAFAGVTLLLGIVVASRYLKVE